MKDIISRLFIVVAGIFLTFPGDMSLLAAEADAEQWTRFENAFDNSKDYGNPTQAVEVRVEFTSPSGNKRTLLGFWDGGRKWRVRFSPDEQGKWTYKTSCSDKGNKGLHNQRGSFRCGRYRGNLPLFRHGELSLSGNRRYFERADGTPFFFLSDTVWCGPLLSDEDDWLLLIKPK